jgi:hypothetical protein
MSLRELVVAYFQYPAIIAYLLLSAVAIGVFVQFSAPLTPTLAAVAVSALIYPLVWYVLHRWVLHSRWMWKVAPLAATWKRIHYDHHQDPNHLEVLFGALHTTLPTIAIATLPIGYAIGSPWGSQAAIGGAAIAFATGLLTTCFYEFCHCIQHLAYKPKSKWLAEMKKRTWPTISTTRPAISGSRPSSGTSFSGLSTIGRAPGEEPHRVQPRLHS